MSLDYALARRAGRNTTLLQHVQRGSGHDHPSNEEQGQRLLRQAPIFSQEVVSDDDDAESLDSRIEEAVRIKFDTLVDELARVLQRHVNEAIQHIVEDCLDALRA